MAIEKESHAAATVAELRSVVLTDSRGRNLRLELPTKERVDADAARWTLLHSVVASPVRDRLVPKLLQSYAAIVVFAGRDEAETRSLTEAARSAIETARRAMPELPKTIEQPPILESVSFGERGAERVLAWAAGQGDATEPSSGERAFAIVLYGRCRRMGRAVPPHPGAEAELAEALHWVGQSCECELDRRRIRGASTPLRWPEAIQRAAANALGFDPESPLVRDEVARILARGPGSETAGPERPGAPPRPPLVYGETAVDEELDAPQDSTRGDDSASDLLGDADLDRLIASLENDEASANGPPDPSASESRSMVVTAGSAIRERAQTSESRDDSSPAAEPVASPSSLSNASETVTESDALGTLTWILIWSLLGLLILAVLSTTAVFVLTGRRNG